MTVTAYDSCTSLNSYVVALQTSPYCYVSPCTCSAGFCYASTCSGTAKGTITSGWYIASTTYASSDTKCANPLTSVYYPLGKCIAGSDGGVIYKADAAGNTYTTFYSDASCASTPTAYYQPPNGQCQVTSSGKETTNGYATTIPTFNGPVQTVTYYSGATCANASPATNIQYVYSSSVTDCTSSACVASPKGTYSYIYTCSGTAPTTGGAAGAPGAGAMVAKTPSMAPIKAGSSMYPTIMPTAEVVYVYVVILVLYGITAADFAKQDLDGKLTLALQQQIASVTGITDLSSIVIDVSSRRMLQGKAPAKATSVSSTIKVTTPLGLAYLYILT